MTAVSELVAAIMEKVKELADLAIRAQDALVEMGDLKEKAAKHDQIKKLMG